MQERKKRVLALAEETAFALREKYIGREMKVLLESPVKGSPHLFSGHTENFLPVWVEGEALRSNEIVLVKMFENTAESLKGKIIA